MSEPKTISKRGLMHYCPCCGAAIGINRYPGKMDQCPICHEKIKYSSDDETPIGEED